AMDAPLNPPPDDSISPKLLISIGIIIGTGFPIFVARIYSRVRPHYKLSWDDYSIILAQACSIAGYALIVMACKYGLGRRGMYVSTQDNTKLWYYHFAQVPLWYCGLAFMRISVASLLLRLKSSRAWKSVLWVIILSQIVLAVFAVFWTIFFCLPVPLKWQDSPVTRKCRPAKQMENFGIAYTAINVTVDLVLSLIPITFVWRLRRPLLERVVVGLLMSMGLAATAAAVIRLSHKMFYSDPDPLRSIVMGTLWCKLEEVIGITAASIPYLKSVTEEVLQR
ncbi:hypothetical protein DL98DRAFT_381750, partial [Cadophora sp. DSE1049]